MPLSATLVSTKPAERTYEWAKADQPTQQGVHWWGSADQPTTKRTYEWAQADVHWWGKATRSELVASLN